MLKRFAGRLAGSFEPRGKFRRPRVWSNNELKRVGHLFTGSVINVSGKVDGDKDGGVYRSYFPNVKEYFISNYRSKNEPEKKDKKWDFDINLDEPLDGRFRNAFDIVFNHTTLEHIFDAQAAFSNLCEMSKDVVIVVVPFMQQMHFGASYKDYWRFSPYAIKEMFTRKGMETVYISANNNPGESAYVFAIGSKGPDIWQGKLPPIDMSIFDDLGNKLV